MRFFIRVLLLFLVHLISLHAVAEQVPDALDGPNSIPVKTSKTPAYQLSSKKKNTYQKAIFDDLPYCLQRTAKKFLADQDFPFKAEEDQVTTECQIKVQPHNFCRSSFSLIIDHFYNKHVFW